MLKTVSSLRSPETSAQNRWGCVLVIVAALLATASYFVSINEYVSMFGEEMALAYDCNGPDSVLVFLVPAVILAVSGGVLSWRAWRRARTAVAAAALCLGLVVAVVELARLRPILVEARRNASPDSPCR
jgi:hypothetical protein